jgi:ankyrin repeat protein
MSTQCFSLDEKECMDNDNCEWDAKMNQCDYKQFLPSHIPKDVSEYAESFLSPVQMYPAYVKRIMDVDVSLLSEDDQRELARRAIEMEDFDILKQLPHDMLVYEAGRLNNLRMLKFFLKTLRGQSLIVDAFHGACAGDAVNVVHYLSPLRGRHGRHVDKNQFHRGAEMAGNAGSERVIFFLVGRFDEIVLNNIMIGSARGGHVDVVQSMIGMGATDFNRAMSNAARGGHIDIVNLMLELGGTNFNSAMSNAARGGHIDIVNLMLELGATDFDSVLRDAAQNGYLNIVKLMLDAGATHFDSALRDAARNGHLNIVKLMLDVGVPNFDTVMVSASRGGHMNVVKLMLEAGAADFDRAMLDAVRGGHIDIVRLMLEAGATNFDDAIRSAGTLGNMGVVALLTDWRRKQNEGEQIKK